MPQEHWGCAGLTIGKSTVGRMPLSPLSCYVRDCKEACPPNLRVAHNIPAPAGAGQARCDTGTVEEHTQAAPAHGAIALACGDRGAAMGCKRDQDTRGVSEPQLSRPP